MKVLTLPALCLVAVAAVSAPSAVSAPERPALSFPLACDPGRTCEIQHYVDRDPGSGTRDYRCGLKTYDKHTGIDIRLPDMAAQRRGVNVLAAAAGRVTRLRDGVQDISIRAPGAPPVANQECGNGVVVDHGNGWETQYCHLARGSILVKQGDNVAAGAPLARVGLSGNTEFPHLHLTVRHAGQVVDPFAPDMSNPQACAAQPGLWTPQALARMSYRAGAVLNAGFTDAQITMDDVEAGGLRPFTAASPLLIAYGRAIALLPGDEVELDLKGPDGVSLARSRAQPLQRWRAQDLLYVGKRRPATGWPRGLYIADYKVWRAGKVAVSRRVEIRL
ncbi:MAG: M23 family metallopeptidase [Phenylobacterium sp.]|uniref:M23 family metallopeptidase n=1 Tax=Phenylobacterium sp. TaxID=1871053 RepID=UPI0012111AC5|nr:M23 family metallopeptidase [Phenylobacterium sp.]TAJ72194.1 MAG: M23 family metallopeptidase [Phenylobacterium sp.]